MVGMSLVEEIRMAGYYYYFRVFSRLFCFHVSKTIFPITEKLGTVLPMASVSRVLLKSTIIIKKHAPYIPIRARSAMARSALTNSILV